MRREQKEGRKDQKGKKVEIQYLYLFKHPLGVGYASGLLPAAPGGEVVAGGELVHGDHGAGGLLAAQLQHGEQVQRNGAHVRQRSHLNIEELVLGLMRAISDSIRLCSTSVE